MVIVEAVACHATHGFSKPKAPRIRLLAGLGVEGDAHCGATVRHRSRVARDPSQPNLRQVHLFMGERLDSLRAEGFAVAPGVLGENLTTRGIDLLALPRGAVLRIGATVALEVTGLRNPCHQLDDFAPGLMRALLGRDAQGGLLLLAGVMAVVRTGGEVVPGDPIALDLPPLPHERLARV
jgi:MOSC domain-containing protein YiiM